MLPSALPDAQVHSRPCQRDPSDRPAAAGVVAAFLAGCLAAIASAVTDNADGTSGNAPCIDPYLAVCGECNPSVGEDPHTVHGCEASDGGLVAVGQVLENRSWWQRGSRYDAFVIKTKGGCTYSENNYWINQDGVDCDGWDWLTKLAVNDGDNQQALGVAKSLDGTYFIVVGMEENDGKARIFISKLDASNGAIVWYKVIKSNNESLNASAETVAFLSDGSFVVGGGVNSIISANEMHFKSGG